MAKTTKTTNITKQTIRTIAREMGAAFAKAEGESITAQGATLASDHAAALATWKGYKAFRGEWIGAYCKETKAVEATGRNRWGRIFAASGLKRPRSDEAARKAAERAAKKAASPTEIKLESGKDAGSVGDAAPPASGMGVGERLVEIILNAREAHLVALIHQGKWDEAKSFLTEMATLSAAGTPQVGKPRKARKAA